MMDGQYLASAERAVDRMIALHPLPQGQDHECPYLPAETARSEGFAADSMDPLVYRAFLDRGFRRSGRVIYRPACPACGACTPIRVPVRSFRRTRSMRRVQRRDRDLSVAIGQCGFSDEKLNLYARYLEQQHDGTMTGSREEFVDFLCRSPVDTFEFRYSLGRRLIGVSVVDRCPGLLSSVYMYFDPDYRRRSLGTYSILREILYARDVGLDYYYLGYYVASCPKMSYKANFRPYELLRPDARWELVAGAEPSQV